MARFFAMMILVMPLTGCFSLFGDDDELNVVDEAVNPAGSDMAAAVNVPAEDADLKMAKLWSRVSEMEEELFRQKEKIRLLEKGLMLGLVPEELKEEHQPIAKREPPPQVQPVPEPMVEPSPFSPAEKKKYEESLAKAHELYRSGRYGVAIKAFSEVHEEFGNRIADGMAKYWIAKCWSNLKEYSIAQQTLSDFVKDYPGSPFVPRAKLEMGRIHIRQGMRETAIENFRTIIDQYPYEDAAEMAKMELQRLENTL